MRSRSATEITEISGEREGGKGDRRGGGGSVGSKAGGGPFQNNVNCLRICNMSSKGFEGDVIF